MSLDGNAQTFIPYTLNGVSDAGLGTVYVPYTGAISDTDLGSKAIRTTNTPALANDLVNKTYADTKASLNANNVFGGGFTNNLNGGLKTVNDPIAVGSPGVNAESLYGNFPATYTLVGGFWRFVTTSTSGSLSFPGTLYTNGTSKYIVTLTGCSTNGTAVVGTVYNNGTATTVSDAPQTITSTPSTVTLTFTPGTSNQSIYLVFTASGSNYFVQYSTLTVQQCDAEILGDLVLDSKINSDLVLATGKTASLAGGLTVSQTSTGVSAATFTQTGMPAFAPVSTLTFSSPVFTLAGAGAFATWLGSGTTYVTGAKYSFTFGTMFGSQWLQLQVVQYNVAGTAYVVIGDNSYGIPSTSSTITGAFTTGSNVSYLGAVVFYFQPTIPSQNVKFNTFTMTKADVTTTGATYLTGVATASPSFTLGVNGGGLIVRYTNPVSSVFTGSVSSSYVPYATSANVLGDSIISQSGTTVYVAGDVTCSFISPLSGYVVLDDRSLRPRDIFGGSDQLYFASWNNDNSSPYADAIGMNGWTDASGGNTNVLMVRKDTFGIRQYQGTFGSTTPFSSTLATIQYQDVCMKSSGDNTFTYFVATGGTWGTTLAVGSGTNKGLAQVFTSDGNLHLDALAGKDVYIGFHNGTPPSIRNYASSSIINNTRYQYQYANVNADASAYFQNANAGSSAYFNIIIANDAGNTNNFMNSSTRTADGGVSCYTIRNDVGGGVRFQSTIGGFSSYGAIGSGGATYTNTIYNSFVNATNPNLVSWAISGHTLFSNTSQPAGTQAALGLGTNNFNTNFITSLSPSVRWMDLVISAQNTFVNVSGLLSAYTVAGGWINVSDAREKEEINDLKTSRSLERILKCRPKHYKRKYYDGTPVDQAVKDTVCIGLLAQDVLSHTPHCVSGWTNDKIEPTDEDDGKRFGINYGDFTVHLIGAVQEQQKQIAEQASRMSEQEKKIAEQAGHIETLSVRSKGLEDHARQLEKDLQDYKTLTDSRFDKMAALLGSK